MSRPTMQQGQSRAISQAYSALLGPSSSSSIQGLVEPRLHKVYFHCHAPQEEGLGNDAITVMVSEEVCLPQQGRQFWKVTGSARVLLDPRGYIDPPHFFFCVNLRMQVWGVVHHFGPQWNTYTFICLIWDTRGAQRVNLDDSLLHQGIQLLTDGNLWNISKCRPKTHLHG